MRPPTSSQDAPWGLEPLRAVPRAVFAAAALLGLAAVGLAVWLHGAQRHLALLAGIVLLDFGQAGLRRAVVPWLRTRWRRTLLVALVLAGAFALLLPFLRNQRKAAAIAPARFEATATVRETAGLAREQDVVVLPLPAGVPATAELPAEVAVYDGLERLPAALVLDGEAGAALVVCVRLGAHETRQLEVYFGADAASAPPDPEQTWTLGDEYRRAVLDASWSVLGPESAPVGSPFLGSAFLRVSVVPVLELPDTFLWLPLPVALPPVVTERLHLLYAVRLVEPSPIAGSVQVQTDQGYLWSRPAADQNGLDAGAMTDLSGRAHGRWYLRRVPLRDFAGARLESAGVLLSHPSDAAAASHPAVYDFDAVLLVEGSEPPQGQLSSLRTLER